MADPLKLVHDYLIAERQIKEFEANGEKYYVFGELAYKRDTPTNLKVYGKNDYYTLEALLILWENRSMAHTTYVKDVVGRNIPAVTRPDRRELLEYLKGEREQPPSTVDPLAPVPAPIPFSRLSATVNDQEPSAKRPRLEQGSAAPKNPRLVELLKEGASGGLTVGDDTSNVRQLNKDLTPDKIVELKKKMKKNQRNTISATNEEQEFGMDVGAAPTSRRDVATSERVWRNRTNCLEANTKQFTSVLQVLTGLKMREDATKVKPPPVTVPAARDNPAMTRNNARPAGYSRYDQELFNKEQHGEFNIDTDMSFAGAHMSLLTASGGLSSANRQQPIKAELSRPQAPLAGNGVSASAAAAAASGQQKRVSRTPIIIIPAASTSLISMYNVKDLLQEMRYVSSEERKRTVRRENETLVQRRKQVGTTTVTVPYRVVDNAQRLSPAEWDRVVAVFVMGPAWQFKGWPWGGNPVEIFSRTAAFYLCLDDQKEDPNINKWNVTKLKLAREKRHLDRATLVQFWQQVDRFAQKNKPHLRT